MSRASEEVLSGLHNALTEELIRRIENGDASASDLAVAAKLLKDNNITCVPTAENAMGKLQDKLDRQRERRASMRATVTEIDEVRKRALGG